eukprot:TRINITY_DN4901_c0_g1_i3.p1 TRINITY_DN4901_c0_g1~~TRINITY_DN4901_c0_g1_i3.p1  ORF type:complete len:265 (-),score=63.33 TRINITY_DN4901_c0_g1_i3:158-952(-)
MQLTVGLHTTPFLHQQPSPVSSPTTREGTAAQPQQQELVKSYFEEMYNGLPTHMRSFIKEVLKHRAEEFGQNPLEDPFQISLMDRIVCNNNTCTVELIFESIWSSDEILKKYARLREQDGACGDAKPQPEQQETTAPQPAPTASRSTAGGKKLWSKVPIRKYGYFARICERSGWEQQQLHHLLDYVDSSELTRTLGSPGVRTPATPPLVATESVSLCGVSLGQTGSILLGQQGPDNASQPPTKRQCVGTQDAATPEPAEHKKSI